MGTPGIPFDYIELKVDNGQEDFDWYGGQISAQRTFWGDWDKRLDFIAQYLTYVVNADGNIVVSNSSFYPDLPGIIPLSASIKGWGATNNFGNFGMISFQKAKITIKYGIPPGGGGGGGNTHNPNGDVFIPFAVESGTTSSEVQIFEGPFRDESNNIIDGLNEVARVLTKHDITVTHSYIVDPLWSQYKECFGKINQETLYLPSGNSAGPGEALYHGYTYQEKYLPDATKSYELAHKLSLRTNPRWDQELVKDTSTGFPILSLLPIDPGIFDSTELNQLFVQAG